MISSTIYSTTQRLKSKLDSVGGTFFVCHLDGFLSLRKSPGSIIDFDISVSAKAAREDFRSNDVLWRVNFGHINRCLQHVACAELVREEVNESASRLLLAMLEISRLHGHITNDGAPVQLSEADILERLISDFPQKSASEVEVSLHECLTTLQNDPWKLLSAHLMDSAGNIQERYSVDFSRILDMIRVKEQLEAVVRERFGGPACRIFRLLLLKHNLEQKQIAEMAMISIKDTRELLYKLLKAHYVQIQEVARTVDHAPSRTFYLWHVNLSHVSEHIGMWEVRPFCIVSSSCSKPQSENFTAPFPIFVHV